MIPPTPCPFDGADRLHHSQCQEIAHRSALRLSTFLLESLKKQIDTIDLRTPFPSSLANPFMTDQIKSFVIVGVTTAGRKFRPSDWADRLCGVMSAFGADHRMTYSPYVRPGCTLSGDKTVIVDAKIYEVEPLAYKFLVNFAKDNDLQVEDHLEE